MSWNGASGTVDQSAERIREASEPILEVHDLTKTFEGVTAVDAVSFDVPPSEVTSLIGPNGAGKTTIFNCLTGVLPIDRGHVIFRGTEITHLPIYRRATLGIGRTFQRLEVFTGMTVFQNLQVAVEAAHPTTVFRDLIRLRHPDDPDVVTRVDEVIDLVGLQDVRNVVAGSLSTGTLRLVELGRALCTEPSLLLLDEPGSGLDTNETRHLATVLDAIVQRGIAVLLVEHDVDLVMQVSRTVHVLEFGQLIATGTPGEIAANADVRRAYLGTEA